MEEQIYDDEISLQELWQVFRNGLVFVATVTVLVTGATYLVVRREPPVFEASATILASQPDSGLQAFNVSLVTAPNIDVSAYEAAAKSTPVLSDALRGAGMSLSRTDLASVSDSVSVTAQQDRNSSLLHVAVKNKNPETAASLANAVASALLAWDKDRATSHLETIIGALQSQIASLDDQIAARTSSEKSDSTDVTGLRQLRAKQSLELNTAEALKSSAVGRLEIVQPAQTPLQPVRPRPTLAAAVAAALAIVTGYLLVFIRAALDNHYQSTDAMSRDLDLDVLGEFPVLRRGTKTPSRERINFLRTNLSFALATEHPKVIQVSSADSGEGKTTLSVGLALAYARNEYRTLLIDADLRKPDVTRFVSVQPYNASDVVATLRDPNLIPTPLGVGADGVGFDVLPTSSESERATELLSRGFRSLLSRLSKYDVIVVDSAPVLPVADSLAIAPHVSGVVLALNIADTDRRRAKSAAGLMRRLGVTLLGLAVTHVPDRHARRSGSAAGYGYGYGLGSGYGYGQGSSGEGASHPIRQTDPTSLSRSAPKESLPFEIRQGTDQL